MIFLDVLYGSFTKFRSFFPSQCYRLLPFPAIFPCSAVFRISSLSFRLMWHPSHFIFSPFQPQDQPIIYSTIYFRAFYAISAVVAVVVVVVVVVVAAVVVAAVVAVVVVVAIQPPIHNSYTIHFQSFFFSFIIFF